MTIEKKSAAYPEYDDNGRHNPVRLPLTEHSEQWEKEIVQDGAEYDPYDIDAMADEPNR